MSRVFIGVGHGGKDPGAVANGMHEADLNLRMAKAMKAELERHGVVVGISRTSDQTLGLAAEVRLCNAFKPDLAVECHNNIGCGASGKGGFEVYRQQTSKDSYASQKLAEAIEAHVVKEVPTTSRGIKGEISPAGGYVFGWLKCKCPSVLCEGGFLDSTVDGERLRSSAEAYGVAYARATMEVLSTSFGGTPLTVTEELPAPTAKLDPLVVGNQVMVTGNQYSTGKTIPLWVKTVPHVISRLSGDKALLGEIGGINSWVYLKDIRLAHQIEGGT